MSDDEDDDAIAASMRQMNREFANATAAAAAAPRRRSHTSGPEGMPAAGSDGASRSKRKVSSVAARATADSSSSSSSSPPSSPPATASKASRRHTMHIKAVDDTALGLNSLTYAAVPTITTTPAASSSSSSSSASSSSSSSSAPLSPTSAERLSHSAELTTSGSKSPAASPATPRSGKSHRRSINISMFTSSSSPTAALLEPEDGKKKSRTSWAPTKWSLFKKGDKTTKSASDDPSAAALAASADGGKRKRGSFSELKPAAVPTIAMPGSPALPGKKSARQRKPIHEITSTPAIVYGQRLLSNQSEPDEDLPPLKRERKRQEQISNGLQMWLFQISSAADNYIGKMQIAEQSNPGTQLAQLLLAYGETISEVDASSLLVSALKHASTFVNILAELNASLHRNYAKKIVVPFKAVVKSSITTQAATRMITSDEETIASLEKDNRKHRAEIMAAVVSYMEVYYSFFKIGKERFQSTLPYAQEYRSLIELEEEAVFMPEIGQAWEPDCKDIIKQGSMDMVLLSGTRSFWFVLLYRCLYYFKSRSEMVVAGYFVLDNYDVKATKSPKAPYGLDLLAPDGEIVILDPKDLLHQRSWETAIHSCIFERLMGAAIDRNGITLVQPSSAAAAAAAAAEGVSLSPRSGSSSSSSPSLSPVVPHASEVPDSVEAFFQTDQFSKYWRDFRAKTPAMMEWLAKRKVMSQLIKFLTLQSSSSSSSGGSGSSIGSSSRRHHHHAQPTRSNSSPPGGGLRTVALQYASLAATIFQYDPQVAEGFFGAEGAKPSEKRRKLLVQFFAFLDLPPPLDADATVFFFDTLKSFATWRPAALFGFINQHHEVLDRALVHIENERLLRFLLGTPNYERSAAHAVFLNLLGTRVLQHFLDTSPAYENERFENLAALLRTLLRNWKPCILVTTTSGPLQISLSASASNSPSPSPLTSSLSTSSSSSAALLSDSSVQPFVSRFTAPEVIELLLRKCLSTDHREAHHAIQVLELFLAASIQASADGISNAVSPQPLLAFVVKAMPDIKSALDTKSDASGTAASSSPSSSLGFRRLNLVRLVHHLLVLRNDAVDRAIVQHQILLRCFELGVAYAHHSILQTELLSIGNIVFSESVPHPVLVEHALAKPFDLPNRVMAGIRQQVLVHFYTDLANRIQACTAARDKLRTNAAWSTFVADSLRAINEQNSVDDSWKEAVRQAAAEAGPSEAGSSNDDNRWNDFLWLISHT